MPFGTFKLNDGNEIPAIAYGTGTANAGKDVGDLVELALETGFTHIDTAQIYKNEAYVGEGLRLSGLARADFYVTTKYWSGSVRETAEASLSKLGLKQVDLYLVHQPWVVTPDLESFWREIESLKTDGLAKSIGVSNFSIEDLEKLNKIAKIKPAVNQVNFHPYNWEKNKPLLEYANKHGIVLEAYSSLTPITKNPGGPVDAPAAAAAKRIGASPAQVLLSWVASKGVVIVTTSSKKSRLEEYLAVADLPPLTNDEIAEIDAAGIAGPSVGFNLKDHWCAKFIATALIGGSLCLLYYHCP